MMYQTSPRAFFLKGPKAGGHSFRGPQAIRCHLLHICKKLELKWSLRGVRSELVDFNTVSWLLKKFLGADPNTRQELARTYQVSIPELEQLQRGLADRVAQALERQKHLAAYTEQKMEKSEQIDKEYRKRAKYVQNTRGITYLRPTV